MAAFLGLSASKLMMMSIVAILVLLMFSTLGTAAPPNIKHALGRKLFQVAPSYEPYPGGGGYQRPYPPGGGYQRPYPPGGGGYQRPYPPGGGGYP